MTSTDDYDGGVPCRVGVVGPADLVASVLDLGSDGQAAELRGYSYAAESEAPRSATEAIHDCDSVLFTGPIPYDLCESQGILTKPAVYIPLVGDALYRALLTVALSDRTQIEKASIDTIAASGVSETYSSLGLSEQSLHIAPYEPSEQTSSTADLVTFHLAARESGCKVALTCRRSVERHLINRGIPVIRVTPTVHAVRNSIRSAIVSGRGQVARESQIVFILVAVDRFHSIIAGAVDRHQIRELIAQMNGFILRKMRRLRPAVASPNADQFVIVTTRGDFERYEHEAGIRDLISAADAELGLSISVGVGMGSCAQDAEDQAHLALGRAQGSGGKSVEVSGFEESRVHTEKAVTSGSPALDARRAGEDWQRIVSALRTAPRSSESAAGKLVVDCLTVAEAIGVSERSARRILNSLVAAQLAWPATSAQSLHGGRPRRRFRLADRPRTTPAPPTAEPELHDDRTGTRSS